MASHEWRVINELIRSRDMKAVQNIGFNADHLAGDPEVAQIFEFIRIWHQNPDTFGQFPTMQAIKKRWPGFMKTSETDRGQLKTLLLECKGSALVTDLRSLSTLFQELVDDSDKSTNPNYAEEVIKTMQSYLAKGLQNAQSTSGFSVKEIAESVKSQYEGAGTGAIFGIPWVWEPLTTDTLGKHKEDLIALYGRMKSMKTWVLLVSAIHDYMRSNRRVLIWSREMNKMKMSLRAGSIIAGVDYQCLKNGTLPWPLYQRAIVSIEALAKKIDQSRDALESIKKNGGYDASIGGDLFVVCGRHAPKSLEAFESVVKAFSPDIIYLDSFYHMECAGMVKMKSDHERQRELSIQVKSRAVDWEIPVVVSTQANREGDDTHGETMADIGRTDALAQEADLIIRILYRKGPDPFEDDYEGYWERLKQRKEKPVEERAGRMRLGISAAAAARFGRKDNVPQKIIAKVDRLPKEARKSAELFLMMGGNREGVLDGFSIRCIPGYCWEVTRDSVTKGEVKELFKGKEGRKSGGKKKDHGAIDPANAGMNFSE